MALAAGSFFSQNMLLALSLAYPKKQTKKPRPAEL
jgi:hypothetical protein